MAAGLLLAAGGGASASTPWPGRGLVVRVAGHVITQRTVDHWMFVVGRSQVRAGKPVIVPRDPPRFARCVRAVRRKIPGLAHVRTRRLRRDCRLLFDSFSSQVLSYLIRGYWIEGLAAANHVRVTHRQVVRAFRRAKRQQFGKPDEFKRFLKQTGQTVNDLLFRFRVSLTFHALLKRAHDKSAVEARHDLDSRARRRYRPLTTCTRYYVMVDCGNFKGHRH